MTNGSARIPVRWTIVTITVAQFFLCGPNCLCKAGSKNLGSWNNLLKVTRGVDYSVVTRTGECTVGRLGAVKADYLTLKLPKGKRVTVRKQDILRVAIGSDYIVYSGRSSWSDVRAYNSYPTEAVKITAKATGQLYIGKIVALSSTGVTLREAHGTAKLAKNRIATVSIISYTPLSPGNEYWAEECFLPPVCLLDVGLWPRVLGYHLRIAVLLYDSLRPEDDSTIVCK